MRQDTEALVTAQARPKLGARLLARLLERRISRLEANPRGRLRFWRPQQRQTARPGQRYLSPGVMRAFQDIRLRRTVAHVARRSPFYRVAFAKAGIRPKDIRGVAGISRLPFTTPADLLDADKFLCVPWDEVSCVYTTSGTTKEPKRIYRSARDFERMVNFTALLLRARPTKERPVCLIAHAQGLFGLVEPAQAVVQRAGGLALAVGQPLPAEALAYIVRFRPNAIMTSPSYMAALTRAAQRAGVRLPLSYVLLDGEVLTPGQAQWIAAYWGGMVFDSYGLTEIGPCAMGFAGCDAMHLNEFQVLTEIVDPGSGQPGLEGELVFTTLAREAMPLLRYRSGDRGRWARCSCDSPMPAIVVEGRLDDTIVVAANNLYAPLLAEAIAELDGVNGSLEMLVDHVDYVDRLTVRVGVEPGRRLPEGSVSRTLFSLWPALDEDFRAQGFDLKVEEVEDLRLGPKALRVRDLRQ